MTATIEKNTLHITDFTGDTRLMWDPRNKEEVAAARAAFDEAKKKKMLAYKIDDETGERSGEVIREFDPTAAKIVMVRQTVGG